MGDGWGVRILVMKRGKVWSNSHELCMIGSK